MDLSLTSWSPLVALGTTWLLLKWMLKSGVAYVAMDLPNQRSLHERPIPRSGGLAVMAGILTVWLSLNTPALWPLALAGGGLMAVSFFDDLFGVSVGWRFAMHLAVAIAYLHSGSTLFLDPLVVVLLVLMIVWAINLYNFMDGANGLAGGMAFFGFGCYGLGAWLAGDVHLANMAWAIAFAVLSFLFFNFHPAQIFLGDGGSVPLGFFMAALGIYGYEKAYWAAWFPFLVFSPFILDATVTLLRRAFRGEKIWHAHREHYYQRLIRMGWSHRRLALWAFSIMIAAGLTAVWGNVQAVRIQYALIALWGVTYLLMARWVDIKWAEYLRQLNEYKN